MTREEWMRELKRRAMKAVLIVFLGGLLIGYYIGTLR